MTRKTLYLGGALLGLLGTASIVLTACSKSGPQEDANISHYTCPMHPQIHKDHPGDCPICGMKLVPVYKESSPPSPSPALMQERGTEGVRISPERQQLIGLKTASVTKGDARHPIRTVGFVHRDLYGAAGSGPVLIDANLYPSDIGLVSAGTEAVVSLPSGGESWEGRVRSVDASINPATRSVRARIEVLGGQEALLRQNHVAVLLKVGLGDVLTIPRSAVIDTGERQVAYVVSGDRFEARTIQTGPETALGGIVVREGLQEGETVVSSAAFLVDSESRLKSAKASPSTPSCPEGQYWDVGMAMCMPKTGS